MSSTADCSELTNVPFLHSALLPILIDGRSINHDQNASILQSQVSGFPERYLEIQNKNNPSTLSYSTMKPD